MTATIKASKLTKNQKQTHGPRKLRESAGYGTDAKIRCFLRYDDECGNGNNSFAITGEIYSGRQVEACGCLHQELSDHFPEFARLAKWHLCGSDGPMHYIANTIYHAKQHGPTSAWVYHEDKENGIKKTRVKYCRIDEAERIATTSKNYSVVVDEKTAKTANLEHARASAIWPDATDEDLTSPGLEDRLKARLPQLLTEFRLAMESVGFTF